MINVLIVEDSPVVREFLIYILSSDPQIHIIGIATNGEEALKAAGKKKAGRYHHGHPHAEDGRV